MNRRIRTAAIGIICFAVTAPLSARAQYPTASDVASPEAIVNAAYESIQRAPGGNVDWDRFRSLFLADATLVPNTEQTGGSLRILSPEDFVAWVDSVTVVGGASDRGFVEEEVHHVVERYGDIAHVFSTYQKRFWEDDQVLGRGINAFQLIHNDDRWWIVSIAWDEEGGAGPIPRTYLGN